MSIGFNLFDQSLERSDNKQMKNYDKKDIERAEYLKRILSEMGIEWTPLSLRIGTNRTLIRDIITRKTKSPKVSTWESIAIELGLPVEELIFCKKQTHEQINQALAADASKLSPEDRDAIHRQIKALVGGND